MFCLLHNLLSLQLKNFYWKILKPTLVDDLAIDLSRFLIALVISQDSFAIPSTQDSCLKTQIWTFWQDPCRYNLVWQGKKCFARQDSCVLVFLTDSFFSWLLAWFFFLAILAWLLFSWILVWIFFLNFLIDSCHTNEACFYINMIVSFRYYYIVIINFKWNTQKSNRQVIINIHQFHIKRKKLIMNVIL
jgi:hypothetical protein